MIVVAVPLVVAFIGILALAIADKRKKHEERGWEVSAAAECVRIREQDARLAAIHEQEWEEEMRRIEAQSEWPSLAFADIPEPKPAMHGIPIKVRGTTLTGTIDRIDYSAMLTVWATLDDGRYVRLGVEQFEELQPLPLDGVSTQ